ncbi:MAG: ankyrin repeat domain-containing protein, partial [Wolbachia endosymbiont of Tyrophagus putrescentiae]|nr:ankyrin repeat domain-containing protein [Wolbachia endosymbiont of Tyrophagus putrescentiae]
MKVELLCKEFSADVVEEPSAENAKRNAERFFERENLNEDTEELHQFLYSLVLTKNSDGDNIIHTLAKKGNKDILEMLFQRIENYSKVEVLHNLMLAANGNGDKVVHILARKGNKDILEMLFQYILYMEESGLSIDLDNSLYFIAVDMGIHSPNKQGYTPLHLAIKENKTDTAIFLIKETFMNSEYVHIQDKEEGMTVLQRAVFLKQNSIVGELLTRDIFISEELLKLKDQNGDTVHDYVRDSTLEIRELFIELYKKKIADLKKQNTTYEKKIHKTQKKRNTYATAAGVASVIDSFVSGVKEANDFCHPSVSFIGCLSSHKIKLGLMLKILSPCLHFAFPVFFGLMILQGFALSKAEKDSSSSKQLLEKYNNQEKEIKDAERMEKHIYLTIDKVSGRLSTQSSLQSSAQDLSRRRNSKQLQRDTEVKKSQDASFHPSASKMTPKDSSSSKQPLEKYNNQEKEIAERMEKHIYSTIDKVSGRLSTQSSLQSSAQDLSRRRNSKQLQRDTEVKKSQD